MHRHGQPAVVAYVCLCNFLLITGWLAGLPVRRYHERKWSIWLHFLVKNDVAYKAYTRVLSHTCDTYWGRKVGIGRLNGQ